MCCDKGVVRPCPAARAGIRGVKRSRCGGTADSQRAAQPSPSCFSPCTRMREKREPSASRNATLSCSGQSLLHLLPLSTPTATPTGNGTYPSVAHLAAVSHRRALCPLQRAWAGICGVGGDRQTSGSFPHRAEDWRDFCPSGLHMTQMY